MAVEYAYLGHENFFFLVLYTTIQPYDIRSWIRSAPIRAARYLLTCAARLRASSSSPVLVVVARPTPASSSICSMRASRCVKQIWSETLVQTTSTLYAVLSSESSSVSCGVARWALACEQRVQP